MTYKEFERNTTTYIKGLLWYFDHTDTAEMHAVWPDNPSWDQLASEQWQIKFFDFFYKGEKLNCILHPAKRKISVSIDYSKKHILYALIKDFRLKIDYTNLQNEAEELKRKFVELNKFIFELRTKFK